MWDLRLANSTVHVFMGMFQFHFVSLWSARELQLILNFQLMIAWIQIVQVGDFLSLLHIRSDRHKYRTVWIPTKKKKVTSIVLMVTWFNLVSWSLWEFGVKKRATELWHWKPDKIKKKKNMHYKFNTVYIICTYCTLTCHHRKDSLACLCGKESKREPVPSLKYSKRNYSATVRNCCRSQTWAQQLLIDLSNNSLRGIYATNDILKEVDFAHLPSMNS